MSTKSADIVCCLAVREGKVGSGGEGYRLCSSVLLCMEGALVEGDCWLIPHAIASETREALLKAVYHPDSRRVRVLDNLPPLVPGTVRTHFGVGSGTRGGQSHQPTRSRIALEPLQGFVLQMVEQVEKFVYGWARGKCETMGQGIKIAIGDVLDVGPIQRFAGVKCLTAIAAVDGRHTIRTYPGSHAAPVESTSGSSVSLRLPDVGKKIGLERGYILVLDGRVAFQIESVYGTKNRPVFIVLGFSWPGETVEGLPAIADCLQEVISAINLEKLIGHVSSQRT